MRARARDTLRISRDTSILAYHGHITYNDIFYINM